MSSTKRPCIYHSPPLAKQVVIIKPGAVQTPIWARGAEASGEAMAGLPPLVGELYGKTIDRVRGRVVLGTWEQ